MRVEWRSQNYSHIKPKFIISAIIESSLGRIVFLKKETIWFKPDLVIPWRGVENLAFAVDRIFKSR